MTTKIPKLENNKVLFTNELFKWIRLFQTEKDTLIITPLTKINDLLSIKLNSPIFNEINNHSSDGVQNMINQEQINQICDAINAIFGASIVQININHEKIIKLFYEINEQVIITSEVIQNYLGFLNKNTTKVMNVFVCGFDDLVVSHFNMLNVHILTSEIRGLIKWHNLEQLVMLDFEDLQEIVDKDKFKSWLELKTKTILTIAQIEEYFDNKITMNSFLIHKSLQELK